MRSRSWLVPALGALLAAACSSPRSFVVLSLQSAAPVPITGVVKVIVAVSQGKMLATLTYPPPAGMPTITIDQVHTTDLSVSFTGAQSGTVDLEVTVKDANDCTVGFGSAGAVIRKGDIATAAAELTGAADCSGADGGGGGGDADAEPFPGCDPAAPVCGVNETCQVNCTKRVGECTLGGTGAPGSTCQTNADCAPGSQCFDYSGTGCAVKVCLRFCHDDNGCAALSSDGGAVSSAVDGAPSVAPDGAADGGANASGGDASDGATERASDGAAERASANPAVGGVATKSLCAGPVQCGTELTAYHTCTFACDPRLSAAMAGSSRCPGGLACLFVVGMDQVDCTCPETTRVGTDGDDCTGNAQCAPGYICNIAGGTTKCRAVCRCDANGTTCMAPNECAGGKGCETLTNDTVFGVCI